MTKSAAEIRVGKLLEIRVGDDCETADDVDRLSRLVFGALQRLPQGTRHVTIVDYRPCHGMEPAALERLLEYMEKANDHTQRSSAIALPGTHAAEQFKGLAETAAHPLRKIFFDEQAAYQWIAGNLNAEERGRLRDFLARAPGPN